jgi:PAS domain S-box-containing protein
VTEQKELEARERALALRESRQRERAKSAALEAVMESVPAAILITQDAEGRQIIGNSTSYELLGMAQGENVSKSGSQAIPFDVYVDGRKANACDLPIQRAAATGKPVLGHEHEVRRADGESRWLYGNAVPIFDEDGRVAQVVAAFVDVTERKRAEEQIRDLNADLERRVRERTVRLEEAVRELESFSYTVAHDLRAPLRAMKGFADLVLEDAGARLESQERDYLRRVIDSATRMDALVRDLLAYSRLSRGGVVALRVDLGELIRDVAQHMASELRDQRAELTIEGGIPDVLGHDESLRQVITNLLSNAAKFVPPGAAPRIRIAAQTRDSWVRLTVEDNGIGVEPEYHERIFRVFERLYRSELYPGTGIGLAIVLRAIQKMGGRVGVESELGNGSRFWFELPQAPPPYRAPVEGDQSSSAAERK